MIARMAHPNIFSGTFEQDPDEPAGFRGSAIAISKLLGAGELAVKVIEIAPGNHLCPYHYEYVEEWLVVIRGPVEVRTPGGSERCGDGDVLRFAAGPEGAHRVSSPADAAGPARVLMFSADVDPAVCVYPDSDKLAVYSANTADEVIVRRGEPSSHLDYFDGETP